MIPPPPTSTLFPYTTLFRSRRPPSPATFRPSPSTISATPGGTTATSATRDRKSTRLNSSHQIISYAVFCLKKKNTTALEWILDGGKRRRGAHVLRQPVRRNH